MIFGDGEQERDYVFVHDVVQANWLASTIPLPQAGDQDARAWNIGTGRGTTVNELAELLMRIAGGEDERLSAPERPGERQDKANGGVVHGATIRQVRRSH